jgi:hypothetical protein
MVHGLQILKKPLAVALNGVRRRDDGVDATNV